jgi:hypothetical protein
VKENGVHRENHVPATSRLLKINPKTANDKKGKTFMIIFQTFPTKNMFHLYDISSLKKEKT